MDAKDAELENCDLDDDPEPQHYDIGKDMGLPAKIQIVHTQQNHEMDDDQYRKSMRTLNIRQSQFVQEVLHHAKTSDEQKCWFLSGGAGVGKTHTSNLLYQSLLKFLNKHPGTDPDNPRILLLGPTGKAAFHIHGNTIHGELLIPVNQKLQFKELDTGMQNTLRTRLKDVKYVFIDEVSMVGNAMCNFVHKRLQEISGSPKDFGGYSVIFIGDLFQLKPVCDCNIFQNSAIAYQGLGKNLWLNNVSMFELTDIERQKDETDFAKLLNRLREGKQTRLDIRILQTRTDNTSSFAVGSDLHNYPHLFLENDKVDAHNMQCFLRSHTNKKEIKAIDKVPESMDPNLEKAILKKVPNNPKKTMHLYSVLQIAEELKFDISVNVDTKDRLTNGPVCTAKARPTSPDGKANSTIWVLFDNPEIGKSTRLKHNKFYQSNSYTAHFTHFQCGKNE